MKLTNLITTKWEEFSDAFLLFDPIARRLLGTPFYPEVPNIFRAFKDTEDPQKVKVIILGQDPYHDGSATGLAFDNKFNQTISPSLRNILKEIVDNEDDNYGEILAARETNSHLEHLPEQGVLLLNTALTVEDSKPGSHTELWKEFTNTIITDLNKLDNIVWILWGAHAKSFKDLITNKTHHIIEGGHPSPLNTKIPFRGGKYFSEANAFLRTTNQTLISW